jgi:ribulose-phosphate 3-epimerase
MEIIPIILTADPIEARELMEQISAAKKFKRVQVNFIDGEFVENFSVKPDQLDLTPFLNMMWDAHLMVVQRNLGEYIGYAHKLGFDRVIVQFDQVENLKDYKNIDVDLPTPLQILNPGMFADKELVVIQSAKAGWGGKKIDPGTWERIEWFKKIRRENGFTYKIQVKGGIQKADLELLDKAGVDEAGVKVGRVMEW